MPGKTIDDGPILVDAHLGNLGTFRGQTPSSKADAVWGPNDYDQSSVGSPEVDLARAATSAALLARSLGIVVVDRQRHRWCGGAAAAVGHVVCERHRRGRRTRPQERRVR